MSDEQQQPVLDPAVIGRAIGETAAPFIYDAVKRAMDDWTRERDSSRSSMQPVTIAPWTGGAPTPEQMQHLQSKSGNDDLAKMASDVSDIKTAVQQIANGSEDS